MNFFLSQCLVKCTEKCHKCTKDTSVCIENCVPGQLYDSVCVYMYTHAHMHLHTYVWVNTIELMFSYNLFKEALLFMKVCYCSLWTPHFIAVLYSTWCIFNINFEEISCSNTLLNNTVFCENCMCACMHMYVSNVCMYACMYALWLHVLFPSTLGLDYLVQYFNHLLAKQWRRLGGLLYYLLWNW